jgi:hypothetical protein
MMHDDIGQGSNPQPSDLESSPLYLHRDTGRCEYNYTKATNNACMVHSLRKPSYSDRKVNTLLIHAYNMITMLLSSL